MSTVSITKLTQAAVMLRAVAHPARLQIIELLQDGRQVPVGDLQKKLGVSQSMTSQHLSALKNCGIVDFIKEGNVCRYYLSNKGILNLMDCIKGCCSR